MEETSKRNGIIMLVLMAIMIIGGYFWGQMRKADRVLENAAKITDVAVEVLPTKDEAKASVELTKQKAKEEAGNAKEAIEDTRQKLNGALERYKGDKGITINFGSKNTDNGTQAEHKGN